MVTFAWMSASFLFGLLVGFAGAKAIEYFKNKGKI